MSRLFATNGEKHRIERLRKALLIVREILSISEAQSSMLIDEVEDDKGRLIVRWVCDFTDGQIAAFATAWKLVGESSERIIHLCGDQELDGDAI